MSIDVHAARKRLILMGAINAVAILAAAAAIVAYFGFSIDWALYAFAGAVVAGFAAQIWFLVALRRAERGV